MSSITLEDITPIFLIIDIQPQFRFDTKPLQ